MKTERWCAMMVIGLGLVMVFGLAQCVRGEDPPETVTLRDIEKMIREADAPGVTKLQREEILKRCDGKVLTVSAKVATVVPKRKSEDEADVVLVVYKEPDKPRKRATIKARILFTLGRDEARDMKGGENVTVRGMVDRVQARRPLLPGMHMEFSVRLASVKMLS